MATIEKAGARRAGSGKEKGEALVALPLFSIVPNEREPGTGYDWLTGLSARNICDWPVRLL